MFSKIDRPHKLLSVSLVNINDRALRLWYSTFGLPRRSSWWNLGIPLALAIPTKAVPILLAIVLWCFSLMIANAILESAIDQPFATMNDQSMLTALILSIALYFLYSAIIDALYWVALWYITESDQGVRAQPNLNHERNAHVMEIGFELVSSNLYCCTPGA